MDETLAVVSPPQWADVASRVIAAPRDIWMAAAVGLLAAALLVGVYLGLVTWGQSFEHALEPLSNDWYLVAPIASGFGLQVGLFVRVRQRVLEMATPRSGEMAAFAPYSGVRELGMGVVNPQAAEVEAPEQIVARVKEALEYLQPSQIYLNPDCGFGTFAERPINTPQVASRKLRAMAEAAQALRRQFGKGAS